MSTPSEIRLLRQNYVKDIKEIEEIFTKFDSAVDNLASVIQHLEAVVNINQSEQNYSYLKNRIESFKVKYSNNQNFEFNQEISDMDRQFRELRIFELVFDSRSSLFDKIKRLVNSFKFEDFKGYNRNTSIRKNFKLNISRVKGQQYIIAQQSTQLPEPVPAGSAAVSAQVAQHVAEVSAQVAQQVAPKVAEVSAQVAASMEEKSAQVSIGKASAAPAPEVSVSTQSSATPPVLLYELEKIRKQYRKFVGTIFSRKDKYYDCDVINEFIDFHRNFVFFQRNYKDHINNIFLETMDENIYQIHLRRWSNQELICYQKKLCINYAIFESLLTIFKSMPDPKMHNPLYQIIYQKQEGFEFSEHKIQDLVDMVQKVGCTLDPIICDFLSGISDEKQSKSIRKASAAPAAQVPVLSAAMAPAAQVPVVSAAMPPPAAPLPSELGRMIQQMQIQLNEIQKQFDQLYKKDE